MDFKTFLENYQRQFETRVLPRCQSLMGVERGSCTREQELTLDLIRRGGKRIRSALVAYLCEEKPDAHTVDFEAWLEIFHVALLIHDDLVDHAQNRRGQACFHVALGDVDRAVIWGDFLFACVGQGVQQVLGAEGTRLFLDTFQATCLGQLQDLGFRGRLQEVPSDADLLQSYANKTGIYGFYFPLAGALALLKVPYSHTALWKFSQTCGQLYQIADDFNLLIPDQDHKSAQSDFELYQHTVLTRRLYPRVPRNPNQTFSQWVGHVRQHPQLPLVLEELRTLLKETFSKLSVAPLELSPVWTQKFESIVCFLREQGKKVTVTFFDRVYS